MPDVTLPGCRTTPLASYLTALGVLRVVTRTLDPDAAGFWHAHGFVLCSRLSTVDELVDELHLRFEPAAIVSPWSEGSGLREKSSNRTAAGTVKWVRDSDAARLETLRRAIHAGDRVIDMGLARGWGGAGSDLWDKKRKGDLLQLCRNELPDEALDWLDVAATLGQDTDPSYSRLLGTGGNFGRQDLSATYLSRTRQVFEDVRSAPWLEAALSGTESVRYERDTVGQFDPGRAGGIQSSPLEKADDSGFVNPWAFLLTLEGTLLFASAVVRRHGADYTNAALPFQVRGTTSGHASAAVDESVLGEFWAPEWETPIRLTELKHLLAEGRAQWNDRPARSGLDFARAVANLGVDRGIDAFQRFVFVERLGQNPLAVPAGRVKVKPRRGVGLLAEIDPWLDAARFGAPRAVATTLRGVEQALFAHAGSGEAADLAEVFVAVGECHEAIARSRTAQQTASPLVLTKGNALADELRHAFADDIELRVAFALATARDDLENDATHTPTMHGLRSMLSPLTAEPRRRPSWSQRPVPASLGGGLARALATAARLRSLPRPNAPDGDSNADVRPGVLGPRIVFHRGALISPADIALWVEKQLDDKRIASLLAGLLTVDWGEPSDHVLAAGGTNSSELPALDMLLAFGAPAQLTYKQADGSTKRLLLRPGRSWPGLLSAERVDDVLADAVKRLRIGGIPNVIIPRHRWPDGERLAAALLFRTSDRDRHDMLREIADMPKPRKKMEEIAQ